MLWSILGGLGGSLGRPNLSYLGCRSGPVLYTLSYLILSYLILDILDIFVILGQDRRRSPGQKPRSGAKRSPKGIPPRAHQDPSKRLPRASKSPPRGPWGQIFGRFCIDFGCMFGQCFVDLSPFPSTCYLSHA